MCVGVPARVVEVRGFEAKVDFGGGVVKSVDATCIRDLKPGDYVIVHAGLIISKISESEYRELVKLWESILEAAGESWVG